MNKSPDNIYKQQLYQQQQQFYNQPIINQQNGNQNLFFCAVCQKQTNVCCSNCNSVFYCCPEHQKQDWPFHKQQCKIIVNNKKKQNQNQNQPQIQQENQSQTYSSNKKENQKDSQLQNQQESVYSDSKYQSQNMQGTELSNSVVSQKNGSQEQKRKISNLNQNQYINQLATNQNINNNQNNNENNYDLQTQILQQQQQQQDIPYKFRKASYNVQEMEELKAERQKLRTTIIEYFAMNNYDACIVPVKKLYKISFSIYQLKKKTESLYEFLADRLLYSKCLIKKDNHNKARENLKKVYKYMDQTEIFDGQKLQMKAESQTNQKQFIEEIHKRCNLISLTANLFHTIGDHKSCEQCYVKYVQLVENTIGPESLETSNCYFLTGVYYIQNKQYLKALACMKRSLNIRVAKLSKISKLSKKSEKPDKFEKQECDEYVTDCQYNIGIIYKQMNKKMKAIEFLSKSLASRRQLIGDLSLPVAQCLETLGKTYLEEENYQDALIKFQECYIIRKKIIQNTQHPDIVRICLLIIHLFTRVKQQLAKNDNTKNAQNMLQKLTDHINSTVLDQNLNQYIHTYNQKQKIGDLMDLKHEGIHLQTQNNLNILNSNMGSPLKQQGLFPQSDFQNSVNGIRKESNAMSQMSDAINFQQGNQQYNNDDQMKIQKKTLEQDQQIKIMKQEIENLKKMAFQQNQPFAEDEDLNKKQQEEIGRLNIDDKFMSILTVEDMIAVYELDQQIQIKLQTNTSTSNLRSFILKSNFIQGISQNATVFEQFKKLNPAIFNDSSLEVKQTLDHLQNAQNINKLQNSNSAARLSNSETPNNQNMPNIEISQIKSQNSPFNENQGNQDLGNSFSAQNLLSVSQNLKKDPPIRNSQNNQNSNIMNTSANNMTERLQGSFGNPQINFQNTSNSYLDLSMSPVKIQKTESLLQKE